MPRYRYKCQHCNTIQIVFHGINDKATLCKTCNTEGQMKKLLTVPTIISNTTTEESAEVGNLTNEYIEANREILQQQKEEAKKEEYDAS